jgi:hypothetical protein
MIERTDKDYAIEHFGYLADAADHLIVTFAISDHPDDRADAFQGLESALYEFRKRADRAGLPVTALQTKEGV